MKRKKFTATMFCFVLVSWILVVGAQPARAITISSFSGYSDGVGVVNGKWTGQGSACNYAKGNYSGFLAVDSQTSSYYLKIGGTGFGTTTGAVKLSDTRLTPTVKSWKDTEIIIIIKPPYNFTFNSAVTLSIKNGQAQSISKILPFVAVIKGRGYGQCTWFVAKTRLSQSKAIPPSAYTSSTIDASYIPAQWDCLNYGGRHVGIITSAITKTVVGDTVTYSLNISEMNALCNEKESSLKTKFVINTKTKTVTTRIGSSAGASFVATGYYR